MVSFSFKSFLLSIFLLLITSISFAEEKLILITDKTQSELGRPIRVELYGISLNSKLAEINLYALEKKFGVVTDYSISSTTDERWPNKPVQVLNLKIYPRYTGKITIPRLSINNIYTDEKTINIVKGKTGMPRLSFSSRKPFERQQVQVHIKLTSTDSTARLLIKEHSKITGFESTPLAFKRTLKNNGTYLLEIGWALTPLKAGTQAIKFPPIEYNISGVLRKRFYLPETIITSRKLPQYLPPTISVGKISIKEELSSDYFMHKDSIYYWNIQLKGHHSNPYRLPPVLRQVKSSDKIKILPITSKRSTNVKHDSLTSTVDHSIPFKALESGFLNLPQLRLQYFDPITETINTQIYKTDRILILGAFIQSIVIILTFMLTGWLSWLSYKQWGKISYSKMKYEQAITLLKHPRHIKEIRESINLVSKAEYWPPNLSLSQWEKNWINKYESSKDLKPLFEQLSSAFYSSQMNYNLNKLAGKLVNLISKRKKLRSRNN